MNPIFNLNSIKSIIFVLLAIAVAQVAIITPLHCQKGYAIMDSTIYGQWYRMGSFSISDDGNCVGYLRIREQGNNTYVIHDRVHNKTYVHDRVSSGIVTRNGLYGLMRLTSDYDTVRQLKVKKTKKDIWPTDTLCILFIPTGDTLKIADVENYTFYDEDQQHLIIEKKVNQKDKKNKCAAKSILIRTLSTGKTTQLDKIISFEHESQNASLAYVQCIADTIKKSRLYFVDKPHSPAILVADSLGKVMKVALDKQKKHLAYLASEAEDPKEYEYTMFLWKQKDNAVSTMADSVMSEAGRLYVSPHYKIRFSEDGERLVYGMAPRVLERDSMILEEDIAQVEIWHWDSPRLYTQMETSEKIDKKMAFTFTLNIKNNQVDMLTKSVYEYIYLGHKDSASIALMTDSKKYQKQVTWEGDLLVDAYLFNFEKKAWTLIAEGINNPGMSPQSRYVYWYQRADSTYYFYDPIYDSLISLPSQSNRIWYDELHDTPNASYPYGIAGWSVTNDTVYIYDKFDIWSFDIKNRSVPSQITHGRSTQVKYRYVSLDQDERHLNLDTTWYAKATHTILKDEYYLKYKSNMAMCDTLIGGAYHLKGLTKTESGQGIYYQKENFETYPDYWIIEDEGEIPFQLTDVNPQQKNYTWGSCSLFEWDDYNNTTVTGMIYYPPNFDADKKYPLLVNFYEKSSDDIHIHRAPFAGRSTINYSYYTQLGYVIFNPDIAYTTGNPGDDCYNAVMSGVDALLSLGYIDSTRMGLQGHSWGGYQVAYLLTKTNRFACAESGAPVVNMTSAYGGIRWGSGMSRMFQYEKTQSRLGVDLWSDPEVYLRNSPLFNLHKMDTPVLILHNDEDGAVPWYQGIEYYMALRRLNKPSWLLNYNGEPHWPVLWQNRLDFNIRMQQFFDHYLMGRPMPTWMKEGNTPLEKGIISKF